MWLVLSVVVVSVTFVPWLHCRRRDLFKWYDYLIWQTVDLLWLNCRVGECLIFFPKIKNLSHFSKVLASNFCMKVSWFFCEPRKANFALRRKLISDSVFFPFLGINECVDHNGHCQQFCNNTKTSYVCSCRPGYEVDKDDPRICRGRHFLQSAVP